MNHEDVGRLWEGNAEECPSGEAVREQPGLQDARVFLYFLHVRARKPV